MISVHDESVTLPTVESLILMSAVDSEPPDPALNVTPWTNIAAEVEEAVFRLNAAFALVRSIAPVVILPTVDPIAEPPVVKDASPPSTHMTLQMPVPVSGSVHVIVLPFVTL